MHSLASAYLGESEAGGSLLQQEMSNRSSNSLLLFCGRILSQQFSEWGGILHGQDILDVWEMSHMRDGFQTNQAKLLCLFLNDIILTEARFYVCAGSLAKREQCWRFLLST